MAEHDDEQLLQSVAIQNANAILVARQRAEQELLRAKETLELKTQELAHSLAMMRATLESTTDGILVTGERGNVADFNERYLAMWRLPRDVVTSGRHQGILEVIAPQFADARPFLDRIEEIYASSPEETFDVLELADGRVFERFSRVQVVDARNVGRVWSFRDITKNQRAEEALRASEAYFRELTQNMPQVVWTNLPDGHVDFVNDRWLKYTGQTLEYVQSHPEAWMVALHPDDRERAGEIYLEGTRSGRGFTIEVRFRRAADGAYRWHVNRSVPLRGADGKIVKFIGTCTDIDEQKRAEDALRESQERFATLAELVPQLVWTAAPDGTVDYFNQRWYDYTGTTAAQALGHGWAHVLHPDDREATWERWQAALRSGQPVEVEYRLRGADGRHQWFLARGVPLRDAGGRVARWFGTCTNIEAQKRAEQALREADRAKDEFLAMLGHELRNPLGAIGSAVRVLDSAAKQDATAGRAQAVIERQVGHLVRLVDDLLDVGRVTAGKIALNRRPLDLADAAANVVTAWRAAGRTDRHRVAVEAVSVWVDADETRLEQVIANLLGNALKYTPPGGSVVVWVKADGDGAVLEVQDSGVGIPSDLIGRVFDLFVQGDRALDRAQGGLGIGLTLVRRLVELHGGTVEARSAGLGRGSTFTVRLPAIAPALGSSTPAPKRAGREPRRVLIIEDNEDAREMLRCELEREGHTVYEAAEGQDGIAQALSMAPDVALIDIGLPGLDGYEVARRIRAANAGKSLTLIALTSYGLADDRRRAEEAGFNLHLVKPVDPVKLGDVIATAARNLAHPEAGRAGQ